MRNYVFVSAKDSLHPKVDDNYLRFCVWQQEKSLVGDKLVLRGYVEFTRAVSIIKCKLALGDPKAYLQPRDFPKKIVIERVTQEETRVAGPWSVGKFCEQGARSDLHPVQALNTKRVLPSVFNDEHIFTSFYHEERKEKQ